MDKKYMCYMMKKKVLSYEDEKQLALRWAIEKDEAALKILIEAHVKLAIKIAYNFRYYGVNLSDLIQEGIVGLMLAAQKYDPNMDVRFSGYAKWWVRATIQNYILRNWSIVRFSHTNSHKKIFFNLSRIKHILCEIEDGALPQEALYTLSTSIDVSNEEIEYVNQRLSVSDVSLNACIGSSQNSYQSQIVDTNPIQDDILQKQEMLQRHLNMIQEALKDLDDNEKHIIHYRYLKDDQSLARIGLTLGFTKQRIRQIEQKAMRKIRRHLTLKCGIKKSDLNPLA